MQKMTNKKKNDHNQKDRNGCFHRAIIIRVFHLMIVEAFFFTEHCRIEIANHDNDQKQTEQRDRKQRDQKMPVCYIRVNTDQHILRISGHRHCAAGIRGEDFRD
jgi:hypothetical protein